MVTLVLASLLPSARQEMERLSIAPDDSVSWSLSQSELEFLRFQLAVTRASKGEGSLSDVRTWFDVFYSRIDLLCEADAYAFMRETQRFHVALTQTKQFLESIVDDIDAPDAALRASLPRLETSLAGFTDLIHEMVFDGVMTRTSNADSKRLHERRLLTALLGAILLFFVIMAGLGIWLWRTDRISHNRGRRLHEAHERMTTIVETSRDAVVMTDTRFRVLTLNRVAEETFHLGERPGAPADLVKRLFPSHDPKDIRRRLTDASNRQREGRGGGQVELVAVTAKGKEVPVEISIDLGVDGHSNSYVLFIRDITARKAAEQELRDARDEALAGQQAKSNFVAMMSHEMRTPLNGLIGTLNLLKNSDLSSRQSELLSASAVSANHLKNLVNDVLDLSSFEAGKISITPRNFDPTALLNDLVEATDGLAREAGNHLSWRWVGQPVPRICTDPRRLSQIMLNLIGNAIKFTENGQIQIEALFHPDPTPAGRLELRVHDAGIGISPEDQDRIFEDFETIAGKEQQPQIGTGLGLGIARRMTYLLKGQIHVDSTPGEGSTFSITIPLLPLECDRETAEIDPDAQSRQMTVLVADDNDINRLVLRELLMEMGHEVVEATDGNEAVAFAEEARFDAILMDIAMPGLNGHEATRQIRAGSGPNTDVPIIAVTAHALPEHRERYLAAGMTDCVTKPLDREDLVWALGASRGKIRRAPVEPRLPELIEQTRLASLVSSLPPTTLPRLMDKFVEENDCFTQALTEGRLSLRDIQQDSHRLAGSAASFGLTAMRQKLNEMETKALEGEDPTPEERRHLLALWEQSRTRLEVEIEALTTEAVG
ncbi:hybrid sensor histidine kinase/response regulator [Palleronia caenipelagi]|uniref:histidine kinase n=1 Tax=Palleronia caenipelagi TaxID=2489174 RepID=A0A547Q2Q6_9RHOB|nr:response regulator [Palleronia caenipelagi]TRD20675.1 response regulator [Palleronia caenipelagi]